MYAPRMRSEESVMTGHAPIVLAPPQRSSAPAECEKCCRRQHCRASDQKERVPPVSPPAPRLAATCETTKARNPCVNSEDHLTPGGSYPRG